MQLFIALLASCASVFAAPAASNVHVIEGYQLCRPSEVGFKIQQLSISPQNPQIGQNMTVSVTGELKEPVVGGTMMTMLHASLLPLLNELDDNCGSEGKECPLPVGVHTFSKTLTIPDFIPPQMNEIEMELDAFNAGETHQTIFCISNAKISLSTKK